MTLGASMGLQSELKEVRKEMGESPFEAEQPSTEQSSMGEAAEAVSESLNTVESAVVSAAQSMIPTWDMVQNAMPSLPQAPVIDLTLPTKAAKCA